MNIKSHNNIFSFSGILDSDKLAMLIAEAEKILVLKNSKRVTEKLVYAIFIELLQNLYHHSEAGLFEERDSKVVQLFLYSDKFNYYVRTGNFIRNTKIPALQKWIDEVNSLSPGELKKMYLDVMQNSRFSDKGGANLGIIEVIRKAKNPLDYKFSDVNNNVSYFEVTAMIQHKELLPYKQKETKLTPRINFDNNKGLLQIEGNSFPEDASSFYTPIIDWLDLYILQSGENTLLDIYLEFFNTSSSKYLLEIFKRLKKMERFGNREITVNWYYNQGDDDMRYTGLDCKEISKLNFNIIKK